MAPQQTAHPWHGVSAGENSPEIINAFIEIVPDDTVKYEIDKQSGILKVDRPQKFSNRVPALYGFVPQTYCGPQIAEYCSQQSGEEVLEGDGDPLDICIFTEFGIAHGNILLQAIPIGGLRLIDKGQADDKIIAVFIHDEFYKHWSDIADCPNHIVDRLKHYFLTYKNLPGSNSPTCRIANVYGRKEAHEVIRRSMLDYEAKFR
jgi:inorganic pyrophosphatase